MPDIKTRESVKDIKILDKANVAGERMKKAFIRSKNTADNLMDDGQVSPSEYAEDQTRYAVEDVASDVGHAVKKETDKAVEKGREAFREHRREKRIEKQEQRADEALHRFYEEPQAPHTTSASSASPTQSVYQHTMKARGTQARNTTIKTAEQTERTIKQTAKSAGKATVKTAEKSVKATEKTVKTAEATSKAAVKTAEATAKAAEKAAEASAKAAQKMAIAAKQAAIAGGKAAVAAGKAIVAAVKAIIAAVKELIAAIAAGGWVAVVIIVVICLIALIAASCFGIFFSSEDKNDGSQTMREVVVEINQEYQDQLDSIKANNPYDDLEMSGSRAVWPEVLSVYAVKTTTDPDNPQEVASLNDEKKQLLTDIFWEMNEISYRTETDTETEIIESDDGNGNILEETVEVTKTTLYITVSHKTADEMADHYRFNDDQDSQLEELLSVDNSMWLAVLYGVYGSDDMIVQVALTQVGNVGGEPYWSWYGFGSRVEWCACFVSWCADQCGYIETGVCPKYAGCVNGVAWFQERDQLNGHTRSCGCMNAERQARLDITGQRWGRLVAVRHVGYTTIEQTGKKQAVWLWQCDCGNTKEIPATQVKHGGTRSCGCKAMEHITELRKQDITGERFGRLIAIRPTEERDSNGSVVWELQCDCGSLVYKTVNTLKSGRVLSCGCKYRETRSETFKYRRDMVEGTSVSSIVVSKRLRSNNTSGHTGVGFDKRTGKWHAYINFQKKHYNLGMFKHKSEAIRARRAAEAKLHDPVILEYWDSLTEERKKEFQDYLRNTKK